MRNILILAVLAGALTACGSEPKTKDETAAEIRSPKSDELATLEKASLEDQPPFAGLPDTPIAAACFTDDQTCDINRLQMLKDWPKAWAGDYQARRNVAYMLSNPTVGIPPNPVQGCAWRQAILASGGAQVDPTDASNAEVECGKLSATELKAAKASAQGLLKHPL